MKTEAIDKITSEVNSNKGDHIQVLGEYLIDTLTEDSAAKIMQEDKTLAGAYSEITSKAQKQKTGNSAMIKDVTVYAWLNEYYGIDDISAAKASIRSADAREAATDALSVNILDLL